MHTHARTRAHTNLDNLPEQTQHKMRPTLHHVLGADVDDVTANGAGRVEGQGLVLINGEGVQLALVHGSLIDSVRDRSIDQLANGRRKDAGRHQRQNEDRRI